MRHWKSLKTTCADCRKETNNPYSKRGKDGIERKYCFKCAKLVDKIVVKQLTLFE